MIRIHAVEKKVRRTARAVSRFLRVQHRRIISSFLVVTFTLSMTGVPTLVEAWPWDGLVRAIVNVFRPVLPAPKPPQPFYFSSGGGNSVKRSAPRVTSFNVKNYSSFSLKTQSQQIQLFQPIVPVQSQPKAPSTAPATQSFNLASLFCSPVKGSGSTSYNFLAGFNTGNSTNNTKIASLPGLINLPKAGNTTSLPGQTSLFSLPGAKLPAQGGAAPQQQQSNAAAKMMVQNAQANGFNLGGLPQLNGGNPLFSFNSGKTSPLITSNSIFNLQATPPTTKLNFSIQTLIPSSANQSPQALVASKFMSTLSFNLFGQPSGATQMSSNDTDKLKSAGLSDSQIKNLPKDTMVFKDQNGTFFVGTPEQIQKGNYQTIGTNTFGDASNNQKIGYTASYENGVLKTVSLSNGQVLSNIKTDSAGKVASFTMTKTEGNVTVTADYQNGTCQGYTRTINTDSGKPVVMQYNNEGKLQKINDVDVSKGVQQNASQLAKTVPGFQMTDNGGFQMTINGKTQVFSPAGHPMQSGGSGSGSGSTPPIVAEFDVTQSITLEVAQYGGPSVSVKTEQRSHNIVTETTNDEGKKVHTTTQSDVTGAVQVIKTDVENPKSTGGWETVSISASKEYIQSAPSQIRDIFVQNQNGPAAQKIKADDSGMYTFSVNTNDKNESTFWLTGKTECGGTITMAKVDGQVMTNMSGNVEQLATMSNQSAEQIQDWIKNAQSNGMTVQQEGQSAGTYSLTSVFDEQGKQVMVKTDDSGKPVTDASGNFVIAEEGDKSQALYGLQCKMEVEDAKVPVIGADGKPVMENGKPKTQTLVMDVVMTKGACSMSYTDGAGKVHTFGTANGVTSFLKFDVSGSALKVKNTGTGDVTTYDMSNNFQIKALDNEQYGIHKTYNSEGAETTSWTARLSNVWGGAEQQLAPAMNDFKNSSSTLEWLQSGVAVVSNAFLGAMNVVCSPITESLHYAADTWIRNSGDDIGNIYKTIINSNPVLNALGLKVTDEQAKTVGDWTAATLYGTTKLVANNFVIIALLAVTAATGGATIPVLFGQAMMVASFTAGLNKGVVEGLKEGLTGFFVQPFLEVAKGIGELAGYNVDISLEKGITWTEMSQDEIAQVKGDPFKVADSMVKVVGGLIGIYFAFTMAKQAKDITTSFASNVLSPIAHNAGVKILPKLLLRGQETNITPEIRAKAETIMSSNKNIVSKAAEMRTLAKEAASAPEAAKITSIDLVDTKAINDASVKKIADNLNSASSTFETTSKISDLFTSGDAVKMQTAKLGEALGKAGDSQQAAATIASITSTETAGKVLAETGKADSGMITKICDTGKVSETVQAEAGKIIAKSPVDVVSFLKQAAETGKLPENVVKGVFESGKLSSKLMGEIGKSREAVDALVRGADKLGDAFSAMVKGALDYQAGKNLGVRDGIVNKLPGVSSRPLQQLLLSAAAEGKLGKVAESIASGKVESNGVMKAASVAPELSKALNQEIAKTENGAASLLEGASSSKISSMISDMLGDKVASEKMLDALDSKMNSPAVRDAVSKNAGDTLRMIGSTEQSGSHAKVMDAIAKSLDSPTGQKLSELSSAFREMKQSQVRDFISRLTFETSAGKSEAMQGDLKPGDFQQSGGKTAAEGTGALEGQRAGTADAGLQKTLAQIKADLNAKNSMSKKAGYKDIERFVDELEISAKGEVKVSGKKGGKEDANQAEAVKTNEPQFHQARFSDTLAKAVAHPLDTIIEVTKWASGWGLMEAEIGRITQLAHTGEVQSQPAEGKLGQAKNLAGKTLRAMTGMTVLEAVVGKVGKWNSARALRLKSLERAVEKNEAKRSAIDAEINGEVRPGLKDRILNRLPGMEHRYQMRLLEQRTRIDAEMKNLAMKTAGNYASQIEQITNQDAKLNLGELLRKPAVEKVLGKELTRNLAEQAGQIHTEIGKLDSGELGRVESAKQTLKLVRMGKEFEQIRQEAQSKIEQADGKFKQQIAQDFLKQLKTMENVPEQWNSGKLEMASLESQHTQLTEETGKIAAELNEAKQLLNKAEKGADVSALKENIEKLEQRSSAQQKKMEILNRDIAEVERKYNHEQQMLNTVDLLGLHEQVLEGIKTTDSTAMNKLASKVISKMNPESAASAVKTFAEGQKPARINSILNEMNAQVYEEVLNALAEKGDSLSLKLLEDQITRSKEAAGQAEVENIRVQESAENLKAGDALLDLPSGNKIELQKTMESLSARHQKAAEAANDASQAAGKARQRAGSIFSSLKNEWVGNKPGEGLLSEAKYKDVIAEESKINPELRKYLELNSQRVVEPEQYQLAKDFESFVRQNAGMDINTVLTEYSKTISGEKNLQGETSYLKRFKEQAQQILSKTKGADVVTKENLGLKDSKLSLDALGKLTTEGRWNQAKALLEAEGLEARLETDIAKAEQAGKDGKAAELKSRLDQTRSEIQTLREEMGVSRQEESNINIIKNLERAGIDTKGINTVKEYLDAVNKVMKLEGPVNDNAVSRSLLSIDKAIGKRLEFWNRGEYLSKAGDFGAKLLRGNKNLKDAKEIRDTLADKIRKNEQLMEEIYKAEGVESRLIDQAMVESPDFQNLLADCMNEFREVERAGGNAEKAELAIDKMIKTYEGKVGLNQQNVRMIKELVKAFQSDPVYRNFNVDKAQQAFLFRVLEHHLINLELHGKTDSLVRELAAQEVDLLAMGGGKSAGVLPLALAREIFKSIKGVKDAPAMMYITATDALVEAIQGESPLRKLADKGDLVVIDEAMGKEIMENGLQPNKIYITSNEGLKKLDLDMRGNGKTDSQIKQVYEDAASIAWDEYHSVFHTTDTIHGSTGIWKYIPAEFQAQVRDGMIVPLLESYVNVYSVVGKDLAFNQGEYKRQVFTEVETQPGSGARNQMQFQLDYVLRDGPAKGQTLRQALENRGIDTRGGNNANLLQKMAQSMYEMNGRELVGGVKEDGTPWYGTAEGGVGKLNTIKGDPYASAFTLVDIMLKDLGNKFDPNTFNAREFVSENKGFEEAVGEALAHTTTERMTMLEAMEFLGPKKIIGYSGTFNGLKKTLSNVGKDIVNISGEPKIDMNDVRNGEVNFSISLGDKVLTLGKDGLRLETGKSMEKYLLDRSDTLMKAGNSQQVYTHNDNKQLNAMAEKMAEKTGVDVITITESAVKARFEAMKAEGNGRVADVKWGEEKAVQVAVEDILLNCKDPNQVILVDGMSPEAYTVALEALKDAIHATPKIEAVLKAADELGLTQEMRTSLREYEAANPGSKMKNWMSDTGVGKEANPKLVRETYDKIAEGKVDSLKKEFGWMQNRYIFAPKIGEGLNIFAAVDGLADAKIKGSVTDKTPMGSPFKGALVKMDLSPYDVFVQAMKRGNVMNENGVSAKRVKSDTGMYLDLLRINNITNAEIARFEKLMDGLNDKASYILESKNAKEFQKLFDNVMDTYLKEIDANKAGEVTRTRAGELVKSETVTVDKASEEYMPSMARLVMREMPERLREFQSISDLQAKRNGQEAPSIMARTDIAAKAMQVPGVLAKVPGIGKLANVWAATKSAIKADSGRIGLIGEYYRHWNSKEMRAVNDYIEANPDQSGDFIKTAGKVLLAIAPEQMPSEQQKAWANEWVGKNEGMLGFAQENYQKYGSNWFTNAMQDKFGADWQFYRELGEVRAPWIFGTLIQGWKLWRQQNWAEQQITQIVNTVEKTTRYHSILSDMGAKETVQVNGLGTVTRQQYSENIDTMLDAVKELAESNGVDVSKWQQKSNAKSWQDTLVNPLRSLVTGIQERPALAGGLAAVGIVALTAVMPHVGLVAALGAVKLGGFPLAGMLIPAAGGGVFQLLSKKLSKWNEMKSGAGERLTDLDQGGESKAAGGQKLAKTLEQRVKTEAEKAAEDKTEFDRDQTAKDVLAELLGKENLWNGNSIALEVDSKAADYSKMLLLAEVLDLFQGVTGVEQLSAIAIGGKLAGSGFRLDSRDAGFLSGNQYAEKVIRNISRILSEKAQFSPEELAAIKGLPLLQGEGITNDALLAEKFIEAYVTEGGQLKQAADQDALVGKAYRTVSEIFGGKEFTQKNLAGVSKAVEQMERDGGNLIQTEFQNLERTKTQQAEYGFMREAFRERFGITVEEYQSMTRTPLGLKLVRLLLKAEPVAKMFLKTDAAGLKKDPWNISLKAGLQLAGMGVGFVAMSVFSGGLLLPVMAAAGVAVAGSGLLVLAQRDAIAWKLNPGGFVTDKLASGRFAPEVGKALLDRSAFRSALNRLGINEGLVSESHQALAAKEALAVMAGVMKEQSIPNADKVKQVREIVSVLKLLKVDVGVKFTEYSSVSELKAELTLGGQADKLMQHPGFRNAIAVLQQSNIAVNNAAPERRKHQKGSDNAA